MTIDDPKKLESLFLALISLLANSALQSLGKVINPVTGKVDRNLEAASMTIDWLVMLKEKTKGNLSTEEERILSSYISNLQLNYVDETKSGGKKETETDNK